LLVLYLLRANLIRLTLRASDRHEQGVNSMQSFEMDPCAISQDFDDITIGPCDGRSPTRTIVRSHREINASAGP
jgi:hypothetical protein